MSCQGFIAVAQVTSDQNPRDQKSHDFDHFCTYQDDKIKKSAMNSGVFVYFQLARILNVDHVDPFFLIATAA